MSEEQEQKSEEQKPEDRGQKPEQLKNQDSRLKTLLSREPELEGKLLAALEAGRFFITVTFQKRFKPDDPHDLHHCYIRRQFMVNDVLPSLKQIVGDFKAKEMPGAQVDSDSWV